MLLLLDKKTKDQLHLISVVDNAFSEQKLTYWVMGGFALDAVLGKITRPHDDIDFLIDFTDRDAVAQSITTKTTYDFLVITEWKNYKFVAYDPNRKLRVDFAFFHRENGQIIFLLEGNRFPFPTAVLPPNQRVNLSGASFNIIEPTLIYATKVQESAREKDREASKIASHIDKKLLEKILPTAKDLSQHHFLIH